MTLPPQQMNGVNVTRKIARAGINLDGMQYGQSAALDAAIMRHPASRVPPPK